MDRDELRYRRIMINRAGGNSGSESQNYRISLPASWIQKMGISRNDRNVKMIFDGANIIISKTSEVNANVNI